MRIFPPAYRFLLSLISLVFVFSMTAIAQNTSSEDKAPKIRYITKSNKAQIVRPRIRVIKRGSITSKPTNKTKTLKANDYKMEKKAFKLINEKRISKGLTKLKWNSELANLARKHSQNMAKFSFFSHFGLNGRTIGQRATDFGINDWKAIGENIAYNRGFENPAEFTVKRWMLSPSHRKNLLDGRWTQSGIGLGVTLEGTYFFTQVFYRK